MCIVPGGRAGLLRIAAVLGNAYLSFFIPDYTAYNEMLGLFKNFAAIPTPLDEEDSYMIHPGKVRDEVKRGTSVILTSNPRNPTGQVLKGQPLKEVVDICREKCTLVMDEFYSGYICHHSTTIIKWAVEIGSIGIITRTIATELQSVQPAMSKVSIS